MINNIMKYDPETETMFTFLVDNDELKEKRDNQSMLAYLFELTSKKANRMGHEDIRIKRLDYYKDGDCWCIEFICDKGKWW